MRINHNLFIGKLLGQSITWEQLFTSNTTEAYLNTLNTQHHSFHTRLLCRWCMQVAYWNSRHQRFPPWWESGNNSWKRSTFCVSFVRRIEGLAQPSSQVSRSKVPGCSPVLWAFRDALRDQFSLKSAPFLSIPIITHYILNIKNKEKQPTRTQTCRLENMERSTSTRKMSILSTVGTATTMDFLELLEETEVKRYTFEHDKSPPYCTYNSNHGLFGVTREIDMFLTRFLISQYSLLALPCLLPME